MSYPVFQTGHINYIFTHWRRQLWDTGARAPSTSNNLFCSASLWNYRPTKYDGNLFEKYLQDLRTAVIKIN